MSRYWPAPLAFLVPLLMAAEPVGGLVYTPPEAPAPPDVGPLLLRLAGAAAVSLALCVLALWLARRRLSGTAGPAPRRLRLLSSLSLGNGSFLFLIQAGGKHYAVGVGRGGLQTLTPFPESFAQTLDSFSEARHEQNTPATLPFPTPPLPAPSTGC